MSGSTIDRKFFLGSPGLEYCHGGPIRVGNVVKDMTLPQDSITILDPLPNIIPGVSCKGNMITERHSTMHVGVSAKIHSIFGAKGGARASDSLTTVCEFEEGWAEYLGRTLTDADMMTFVEENEVFRSAVQRRPV